MRALTKNWDEHVTDAEEVSRSPGFQDLRDRILELAAPSERERCVDIGAGTGLLALPLAERAEHVLAVDISPAMCDYLRAKANSAGQSNIQAVKASATSLPAVDSSVDLVVSNYCFHHLDDEAKHCALAEVRRVLRPGGRLVFGDMMFGVSLADPRDRQVVATKVRAMAAKGPAGLLRLAKNGVRFAGRRWESPARARWWELALKRAGFDQVQVELFDHEGGVAVARRP